jgi:hypothetical protein
MSHPSNKLTSGTKCIDWLNTIVCPDLKARALRAYEAEAIEWTEKYLNRDYIYFQTAISHAFNWSATAEGHNFWYEVSAVYMNNVDNKLKQGQRVFPSDHPTINDVLHSGKENNTFSDKDIQDFLSTSPVIVPANVKDVTPEQINKAADIILKYTS